MPTQLNFALPGKPALDRSDFFVAPSNAMAVELIEDWRAWPARKLALSGAAGSGKTHLAHVWAADSGAAIVSAADLASADIPALAGGAVAVEDVPAIAGDAAAQEALFHLHNLALAEGHSLLLTGRTTPSQWNVTLPDLQSRMAATPHVALDTPDDALLGAVLLKLFADRQIAPRPDVIPYLLRNMERSFAAAAWLVDDLDRLCLSEGRNLTRALATRLLGPDKRL